MTNGAGSNDRLFNDAYFERARAEPASWDTWPQFGRPPPELRLRIWLLSLRRNRMIELNIRSADGENSSTYPGGAPSPFPYYRECNHLGTTISGRGYTLSIRGRGFAASHSQLLWVNAEARQAALDYHRVRLPYPRAGANQLLALNPEHDVLFVRPEYHRFSVSTPASRPGPRQATVLVDSLHDVKAYNPQGPRTGSPTSRWGMCLFPPEAFAQPTVARRNCYDVTAFRPGLLLFDLE